MVSKKFYSTAISACILADVYGIIVTPYEEYIPDIIPQRIKWVTNVYLGSFMKKVDLVIHHGGMVTINEVIDAAIPQIIIPHLTDGFDNTDRLVNMGIATKYPPTKWNDIDISYEIKELLNGKVKKKCLQYQQMNYETYSMNNLHDVIPQIKPYVLTKQNN